MSEPSGLPPPVLGSRPPRLGNLRGVQWRIDLGVLPSSPSASIDDLRRVSADSRRRYASLRRRLLVDPHIAKDGIKSPDLSLDNPLSQNPDSSWGRFFRNAEVEKMVDQDLLRLYPEDGSYFQTPGCQGMLRRILLLWSLQHPEYGYRQGMHELLAPLVYVIHVDMEHLYHVKKLHEEYFTDKFDELSVYENDQTYNFDFKKFCDAMDNEMPRGNEIKKKSIDELDPELQNIVLLSDSYGAEGELGIVLSEKFLEHDAYSMFDALMSGANGSVALAEFFAHSTAKGAIASLPPVIEASAALYHLLLTVDPSLHSHLVELGVEPQYFALRWLRVLFGREFSLEDLLMIWDEIFAQENNNRRGEDRSMGNDVATSFPIICSLRGSFIAAIAVTMILHLRSSLLASENATSCLQKLLNFPQNVDVKKLLGKAKSLQVLALEVGTSPSCYSSGLSCGHSKPRVIRGHATSSDFSSPRTPLNLVPDTYWEEMWRVLHKEEELNQVGPRKQVSNRKIGWSERVRMSISRAESDPTPVKPESVEKVARPSVRRNLTEDLSQQLGSEGDVEGKSIHPSSGTRDHYTTEDERLSIGIAGSEENSSSVFSDPSSPHARANEPENDSERCSLVSDFSLDDHDGRRQNPAEDSLLPMSDVPRDTYDSISREGPSQETETLGKEQDALPGKFHWLWKLGRNGLTSAEVTSRDESTEGAQSSGSQNIPGNDTSRPADNVEKPSAGSRVDSIDANMIGSLRGLGQSMLEHIQVIESAFQQDLGQVGSLESLSKNALIGKGQVTVVAALKELRKISSLLSEM
ncbi:hypothetical protein MLD38_014878 [Melastoma candidum]|uniref:Uncharacterized protein n=1 Tax=Melastoma candidum TaxID=119954 RepID=A0ACB9RHB2_9MYRT|nr:hypothetical protein MLD38_014878 [Melastoma candidum]